MGKKFDSEKTGQKGATNDKNEPKRPLTPFFMYKKTRFNDIKQKFPHL